MSSIVATNRGGMCCICWEEFESGEPQFTHEGGEGHDGFHQPCLANWVHQNATCPYDRQPIDLTSLLSRTDRMMTLFRSVWDCAASSACVGAVSGVMGLTATVAGIALGAGVAVARGIAVGRGVVKLDGIGAATEMAIPELSSTATEVATALAVVLAINEADGLRERVATALGAVIIAGAVSTGLSSLIMCPAIALLGRVLAEI